MARNISGTYTSGITLTYPADNSVTVTGIITDPNSNALYGPGGATNSWTIDNSGVIASPGANGVQLGSYKTATNTTVSNSIITNESNATISGGKYGLYISGDGSVTNLTDGNISGGNGAGVFLYGDVSLGPLNGQPNVQVLNAGTLSGAVGVYASRGGTITNLSAGTITGQSGSGVYLAQQGTVINSGQIGGATYGVLLRESGSVTNEGTISGHNGVYINSFRDVPGTFANAGTVIATGTNADAVRFGSGGYGLSYRLIAYPGAVFDGKVNGGGGTVELAAGPTGTVGTLSGFGDTITNFSTLQFDAGADWRISGNAGGLSTMAITGFAGGDIIDLTGFAAVSETFDTITNTLTLTGNSTPAVLNFPDLSSIDDFQFAPDGAGGTDIAPFASGHIITWTATGRADWNTASNWDPGTVPTGFDTAIIANPVSTIATIATKASDVVGSLTIGDPRDTLEVGGTLQVVGTAAIGPGTLAVTDTGTLSAAAITDSGLLAFAGDHTLDNASLDLSGTLATLGVQDGILTLGTGETVTQTAPDAVLDGSGTIINQGSIDATGGSSLTITPVDFINQGTINAGETLTVGNPSGTWSNQLGTIANAFSLILDGTLATGDIGTITNASNVIEAGLLDSKSATLTVGGATGLGAVTLASSGTVSGGTIVDQGSGFAFDGGTLDGVTYQGPLELINPGDNATIFGGLAVTATDATLPGTIDLSGDGAALDFRSTPTLAGVTLNIGASTTADVLQADGGGTFTIGPDVAIVSGDAAGLFGSLIAGSGTALVLDGTLNAISSGGTFGLGADSGGTFANDGTIIVGNGDLLDVNTPLTASSGGTVELNTTGIVNVSSAVSANQTFAFADASGLLRLDDPASFAATITGVDGANAGATVDLTKFQAVDSSYANGLLTLGDGIGNTVTLHIPGTFTSDEFQLTPDGNGTDITWTPVGQTFTWTDGSDNWNTPTAWSLGSVPKSFDSAVIGDAASNTITVSDAEAINNLTLNGTNDTLEITVTGNLQAGPIAINSGTLAVRDGGSLAATQIADHGLLDLGGNHELINTPLSLGGTLQVSPSAFNQAGTLTLGQGVVLTQDLASAVITGTGNDGNSVLNQGTIIAGFPGGSMAIVPMNFTNSGTIRADNETLTIGNHLGSWSNKDGTIALSGTAALVLDGTLATANIGKITGATGVTEAGLLDNTGGTLDVGTGTQLGTVNLANGAVVSGRTIVDHGNGFTFNSDGTFSGVTYKGPLELTEDSASLTINQGITVTGTGGALPGTIDINGASDSLLFANQPPGPGQTLDNVTINIGNATTADHIQPSFNGGTFTIGSGANIRSTSSGALASLDPGANTTVVLDGTISATGSLGTFAITPASGSTFDNEGTIVVGNGDTLDATSAIIGTIGTIDVGSGGVAEFTAAVGNGQTLAFTDANGLLRLADPTSFAAAITNFVSGDTIDLPGISSTAATVAWSAGTLTVTSSGTAVATLSLPGDYASSIFTAADDGAGGTRITVQPPRTFTWTATGTGDWNTGANWNLGTVPTSSDSALIPTGTNTITVAGGEIVGINHLTLDADNTLAVTGSLVASQITDNGVLSFIGNHTLDNTPLNLGGTLAVQNSGTLTLGAAEVITQTASNAMLGGNGTIINQGSIDEPGSSLSITPLSFINQGTINAANETLTVGNHLGTWSNKTGIISNAVTLILDGTVATGDLGSITGATGVTEAGLLNNTGGTLDVGTGAELGTVTLANGAVVNGGTIVDHGNGFIFLLAGNFSGVTYQGPLNIATNGGQLNVKNGLTVIGASGTGPGTINLTQGSDAALNFLGSSQTLDNVTLNIGNAAGADTINAGPGGTFTIGTGATIASTTTLAKANLTVGSGTTVDFDGTLNAAANKGTFDVSGSPQSIFNNSGLIHVGNGDTFSVGLDITGSTGTIDLGTTGVVDLAGSVAAGQTIAFTDATGSLQLHQPGNVAATILNFVPGDTIDLSGIKADSARWSSDQLTISNAGTTLAMLSLPGDYGASVFAVTPAGSDSLVTVTATCFAAGTRILTPHGEVAVEHLRAGDLVQTISGRAQPISWVGHRRVNFRRHPNRQRIQPVRVAAHAFGPGTPRRELLLSPDHAVFVEDVLIPIRHLINGSTVAQIERQAITYYHVELPRHDVLLANGMPAESYLEAGARNAFANGGGTIQLHPDFTPPLDHYSMLWEEHGYAPLVVTGAALERARQTLSHLARLAA